MKHLAKDIWLDADSQCFFFIRKSVFETGKHQGEEKFDAFSFHSTHEQVSKKIADLALMEYVNGDYKRAMNFFTEAHNNLVPALTELVNKRYK